MEDFPIPEDVVNAARATMPFTILSSYQTERLLQAALRQWGAKTTVLRDVGNGRDYQIITGTRPVIEREPETTAASR